MNINTYTALKLVIEVRLSCTQIDLSTFKVSETIMYYQFTCIYTSRLRIDTHLHVSKHGG